jgi:uncharacterized protein YdeI (YjbR/CyaY-like superfamily)
VTRGERPIVTPQSRAEWRAWLQRHHTSADGVWLQFAKKHAAVASPTYSDAVEEALCFGWIDGVRHPVDETYYKQWFAPRKPRSTWAPSNKARVAQLLEAGLIAPAGLAAVELAKKNGSWNIFDAAERLQVPRELQRALNRAPLAKAHWLRFTISQRRTYLYWLSLAKREETRTRRVRQIIELLQRGLTPAKADAARRRKRDY